MLLINLGGMWVYLMIRFVELRLNLVVIFGGILGIGKVKDIIVLN